MPSSAANLIAAKTEEYLGEALTADQLIQCEELNLNYFTGPIIRYIDGLIKKNAPKDFGLVYHAIMNGVMRGALRRNDLIYLKDRMREVYERLHKFVGDDFSQGELESIIFMAEDCSDREINAALSVARSRNVHHLKYVRAVIENNRRAASRGRKDLKAYQPKEYEKLRKSYVPRVDAIREGWRRRLGEVHERIELTKAELNARKNADRG